MDSPQVDQQDLRLLLFLIEVGTCDPSSAVQVEVAHEPFQVRNNVSLNHINCSEIQHQCHHLFQCDYSYSRRWTCYLAS